jgi:hypothetical protein
MLPNGSTPAPASNQLGLVHASSPTELILSTTQDILINACYQYRSNPIGMTVPLMSQAVLEAFQVTVSTEKKDFSLIQKATSDVKIDNPLITDPSIAKQKPGLADAQEMGMTFDVDNPLFEQDAQLALTEAQNFSQYSVLNTGFLNLYTIAARFCAPGLSVAGKSNIYLDTEQFDTRINISGKGAAIARADGSGYYRPGAA